MTSFVDRFRAQRPSERFPRPILPATDELVATLRRGAEVALVATAALGLATAAVAWLERAPALIADASPVYLVAVVLVAMRYGTGAATFTAGAAFLVYDYLFTEPRFTIVVADSREWLELVLFLFVAIVIGRLTARETERAREATRRAEEAEALAAISRMLAASPTVGDGGHRVALRLLSGAQMERVWIETGQGAGSRVVADTGDAAAIPEAITVSTMLREDGERPPRWIAVHRPRPGRRVSADPDFAIWEVPLEAGDDRYGTLRATRRRRFGPPSREGTRLLALAADQLALALRREQLARQATDAEIARQGEALKSALLDAVSHDLRTPLASIRAIAGSLSDPEVDWPEIERRDAGTTIDTEAERLSVLVQKVLDLGRIEGDALRPDLELYDLRELVEAAVARTLGRHRGGIQVDVEEMPPIRTDAVLMDTVLTNLLENAIRYGGQDVPIRLRAVRRSGVVDLTVEDGGSGVPDSLLPKLFDRFYRVPRRSDGSRPGLGIGLSIVQGFVRAIGGEVIGRRSELGGLAIRVSLPIAADPESG